MGKNSDIRELAEEHVEWLISFLTPIIRKVGIEEFVHGYKHGYDDRKKETNDDSSK